MRIIISKEKQKTEILKSTIKVDGSIVRLISVTASEE